MSFKHYNGLGVINRTPNSFSDRGASLSSDHFFDQLNHILKKDKIIFDFGFESTHRMNSPISFEEEMERFMEFKELVRGIDFGSRAVSFDTYKVESFRAMSYEFLEDHPDVELIFNDVSGVLDEELDDLCAEFSEFNFKYIYNFTQIPERALTLKHMNYVDEDQKAIEGCFSSFTKAYEWFKTREMEEKLILDLGLGFSKSYEQNWELITKFQDLDKRLNEAGIYQPILFGLSKKSFMRKFLKVEDPELTEGLHLELIGKLRKSSFRQLLFRVHDPDILPL